MPPFNFDAYGKQVNTLLMDEEQRKAPAPERGDDWLTESIIAGGSLAASGMARGGQWVSAVAPGMDGAEQWFDEAADQADELAAHARARMPKHVSDPIFGGEERSLGQWTEKLAGGAMEQAFQQAPALALGALAGQGARALGLAKTGAGGLKVASAVARAVDASMEAGRNYAEAVDRGMYSEDEARARSLAYFAAHYLINKIPMDQMLGGLKGGKQHVAKAFLAGALTEPIVEMLEEPAGELIMNSEEFVAALANGDGEYFKELGKRMGEVGVNSALFGGAMTAMAQNRANNQIVKLDKAKLAALDDLRKRGVTSDVAFSIIDAETPEEKAMWLSLANDPRARGMGSYGDGEMFGVEPPTQPLQLEGPAERLALPAPEYRNELPPDQGPAIQLGGRDYPSGPTIHMRNPPHTPLLEGPPDRLALPEPLDRIQLPYDERHVIPGTDRPSQLEVEYNPTGVIEVPGPTVNDVTDDDLELFGLALDMNEVEKGGLPAVRGERAVVPFQTPEVMDAGVDDAVVETELLDPDSVLTQQDDDAEIIDLDPDSFQVDEVQDFGPAPTDTTPDRPETVDHLRDALEGLAGMHGDTDAESEAFYTRVVEDSLRELGVDATPEDLVWEYEANGWKGVQETLANPQRTPTAELDALYSELKGRVPTDEQIQRFNALRTRIQEMHQKGLIPQEAERKAWEQYKELRYAYEKAKRSKAPPQISYEPAIYDTRDGELFGHIVARDVDGAPVGRLAFSILDGNLQIQSIDSGPKRQGIATGMYQALAKEYPDLSIRWSNMTEDGANLRNGLERKGLLSERDTQKKPDLPDTTIEDDPLGIVRSGGNNLSAEGIEGMGLGTTVEQSNERREPWQMTLEEFVGDTKDPDEIAIRKTAHVKHVKNAVWDLSPGTVPKEVLEPYKNNGWAKLALEGKKPTIPNPDKPRPLPPTKNNETKSRPPKKSAKAAAAPMDDDIPFGPGTAGQTEQGPSDALRQRIVQAHAHVTQDRGGWNQRVLLKELRPLLPDVPHAELDAALLAMQSDGELVLYRNDNPLEITQEDRDARLYILGEPRDIVYMRGMPEKKQQTPKPTTTKQGSWLQDAMRAEGKTPGRMLNDVDMSRPGMRETLAADPLTQYFERTGNTAMAERARNGDLTAQEYAEWTRRMEEPAPDTDTNWTVTERTSDGDPIEWQQGDTTITWEKRGKDYKYVVRRDGEEHLLSTLELAKAVANTTTVQEEAQEPGGTESTAREFMRDAGYTDALLTDANAAHEECDSVSRDFAGWLEDRGETAEVVDLEGPKFELEDDAAHGAKVDFKAGTAFHSVVKMGRNLYVDLTGRQFGSKFGGIKVYTRKQLLELWTKIKKHPIVKKKKKSNTIELFPADIAGIRTLLDSWASATAADAKSEGITLAEMRNEYIESIKEILGSHAGRTDAILEAYANGEWDAVSGMFEKTKRVRISGAQWSEIARTIDLVLHSEKWVGGAARAKEMLSRWEKEFGLNPGDLFTASSRAKLLFDIEKGADLADANAQRIRRGEKVIDADAEQDDLFSKLSAIAEGHLSDVLSGLYDQAEHSGVFDILDTDSDIGSGLRSQDSSEIESEGIARAYAAYDWRGRMTQYVRETILAEAKARTLEDLRKHNEANLTPGKLAELLERRYKVNIGKVALEKWYHEVGSHHGVAGLFGLHEDGISDQEKAEREKRFYAAMEEIADSAGEARLSKALGFRYKRMQKWQRGSEYLAEIMEQRAKKGEVRWEHKTFWQKVKTIIGKVLKSRHPQLADENALWTTEDMEDLAAKALDYIYTGKGVAAPKSIGTYTNTATGALQFSVVDDIKESSVKATKDFVDFAKSVKGGRFRAMWKKASKGEVKDFNLFEHAFLQPTFYGEEIGAYGRAHEHAANRVDIMFEVESAQYQYKGMNLAKTMRDFRKDKKQYEEAKEYLKQTDQYKSALKIRLNNDADWDVYSMDGKKKLKTFKMERDALDFMFDNEAERLKKAGRSDKFIEYVRAVREINANTYALLVQRAREYYAALKERGQEPPDVVTDDGKIDLMEAMRRIGDIRGSYMPRIRRQGTWVVFVVKDGENPRREHFETKLGATSWAALQEEQGWTINGVEQINTPGQSALLDAKIAAVAEVVNAAMDRLRNKTNFSLKDSFEFEVKKTKDGYDELVLKPKGKVVGNVREVLRQYKAGRYEDVWHISTKNNPGLVLNQEFMNQLAKEVEYAKAEDVDVLGQFSEAFAEEIANIIRSRGSQSRAIGRRGDEGENVWEGYEEDPNTAISMSVSGTAGGQSKLITGERMLAAIMGRDIKFKDWMQKAYGGHPPKQGTPEYKEARLGYREYVKKRRIDSGKQTRAWSDAMSLYRNTMRNSTKTERVVGAFRALTAINYLSKPATGLINSTAMVVTAPAAMKTYGNIPLTMALKNVYLAAKYYPAFVMKNDLGGEVFATRMLKQTVGKLIPTKIPRQFELAFIEVTRRGWHRSQQNREALSLGKSQLGAIGGMIADNLMAPMGATEELNRAATIAAAYVSLQEMSKRKPNSGRLHEENLKKARHISNRSHGMYGPENLPEKFLGFLNMRDESGGAQLARSWYMFKTFPINMLTTQFRDMLGKGVLDAVDAAKDKDWKHVWNRRLASFTYMTAAQAAFGGLSATGISFAASLAAGMLRGLGIGPDEDPEEAMYQFLLEHSGETAEMVARHGIPHFANINLSGSLGVTNLFEWSDREGWLGGIETLGGAPVSFVLDKVGGTVALGKGDMYEAGEKLLPAGFANIVKGTREVTQGITTRGKQPVFHGNEKLRSTLAEGFLRAAGFNPSRTSAVREKQYYASEQAKRFDDEKYELSKEAKRIILENLGDEAWMEFIERARDFNERVAATGNTQISGVTKLSLDRLVKGMDEAPTEKNVEEWAEDLRSETLPETLAELRKKR